MQLKNLSPRLSVASQITPDDIALVAKRGFKSIISNRPDGESREQPDAASIQQAAEEYGLNYCYLPVIAGKVTDQDADAFAALLADLPGPILAYCRTGRRSATLWALAEAPRLSAAAILEAARSAGYELDALRSRIEARAQSQRKKPPQ